MFLSSLQDHVTLNMALGTCSDSFSFFAILVSEHYHMLQPYIDKVMKEEKLREQRTTGSIKPPVTRSRASSAPDHTDEMDIEIDVAGNTENEINGVDTMERVEEKEVFPNSGKLEKSQSYIGSIPSGELTICRVSSVFGHVLCYSKQTKDLFLYHGGQLVSFCNSREDTYYDIQFSKTGNHIVTG